jgi:LysR family glycine cleavage system transcriptional activator
MNIGNLQLNWLRTFEASGRLLSFSLAAEELNLSQSAVSQQIKLLEHKLGKELFLRKTRSLQLTTEGRALLDVVREGLQRLNAGMNNIFSSSADGVLELHVNNTFGELWLAPRIGRFIEHRPQLSVRMLQTNWDLEYEAANTELGIRYGNGIWPGFETRKLLTHTLRPYCSISLAARIRRLDGFEQTPLIDVLGTPNGWLDWKRLYRPDSIERRARIHVDSYAIAASMAIEGIGACLLYDEFVSGSRLEAFLVCPFDAPVNCDAGYYLTWRSDRSMSTAAAEFCAWLDLEVPDTAG